jgi:hypothetical protein
MTQADFQVSANQKPHNRSAPDSVLVITVTRSRQRPKLHQLFRAVYLPRGEVAKFQVYEFT